jgi:hypothetical protein
VRALDVSVLEEKMVVYAAMSVDGTLCQSILLPRHRAEVVILLFLGHEPDTCISVVQYQ